MSLCKRNYCRSLLHKAGKYARNSRPRCTGQNSMGFRRDRRSFRQVERT